MWSDDEGARIVELPVGQGRVILVADSSFLSNRLLGEADNSVLAYRLVTYGLSQANHAEVAFDEYHFAPCFGQTGTGVLAGLLFKTPAGWAVLAMTCAALLWMIHQGRQFGPRYGPDPAPRRSKIDYVRAVGATYRAAGAGHLVLGLVYEAFRRTVAQQAGLPATTSTRVLALELAHRKGLDAAQIQGPMDFCDGLLSRPKVSAGEVEQAIRRLQKIEREVVYGHPRHP